MDTNEQSRLAQRITELTGWETGKISLVTDTSDCMRIQRGDIVRIEGIDLLIKGNRYETRFGIEHQPKYWVFGAIDMKTNEHKILKTVFYEEFNVHIGVFKIHCYRSPQKEADVLQLVNGDMRFMQGYTLFDSSGNNVRVIDFIRGKSLFNHVYELDNSHEQYFHEDLPSILHKLTDCLEAIALLHQHDTCHGDIRNDHILIDSSTGQYRWIDFDLNQNVADFDVWSIGNIISYAVGKGINSFANVLRNKKFSDEVKSSLTGDDASAFYEYRIMNLKKLFPYIPPKLDRVLNHFVAHPTETYSSMEKLIEDYVDMLETEFTGS
ncbi:MAG: hypothetical protein KOO62_02500 [candidate division Zixibacteria bacterium]|nr:hypothetical protein [candidate division Zixibacteria bacterium]